VDNVGIDLGKNQSQIAILTEHGELQEFRIRTQRERFQSLFLGRKRAKVLVEASTESEWVARLLEEMGHQVIVADPNFAPMYAQRSRKVKTDRRDARALVEACRLGAYRLAHRTSDEQRHVRAQLAVRTALVRTRTRYINLIKALLRYEGLHMRTGNATTFSRRLKELTLLGHLHEQIEPLLDALKGLEENIERVEDGVVQRCGMDARAGRLCTAPGIGPITALAFLASVDGVERFRSAHQVEAYLGLVPCEWSSSEMQRRGRITKRGPGQTRQLLVGAGWRVLRSTSPDAAALRAWAERIAVRRGKRIAVVALARRLAGILYAMLRDETEYRARVAQCADQTGTDAQPQAESLRHAS